MKVCWVISEEIKKGTLDANIVKEVAPSWGSWRTWKEHKTDNCICTKISEARDLIKRAFHAVSNLYIKRDHYTKLGNPIGVKLFDGSFQSESIHNKDDIVALNLSVPNYDIVLMSGFNFSPIVTDDEKEKVAREEYYYNVRELIKKYNTTQFVLVDYEYELAAWAKELDNLTTDTIDSVKNLLV